MKLPSIPPNVSYEQIGTILSPEKWKLILEIGAITEKEGKYRHWDVLRHLVPPQGLTLEEWWMGIKLHRTSGKKAVPLQDRKHEDLFYYNLTDMILEQIHRIDMSMGGCLDLPEPLFDPHLRDQYVIHTLIQEAITSSQLEGASTTRHVAKEMLRLGRAPRDESEQMIFNNFRTMEKIREWRDESLTPQLVFEIHRMITENTLAHPDHVGRFRSPDEKIVVEDNFSKEILHEPPDANQLPARLQSMCDFANGLTPSQYVHPIVRAIILHFWLSYDHPFVDGNGRTARALFYWCMLKNKYWIFEFISISEMILKAPAQYGQAFLYTETDQNDLTYFILHQITILQKSINSLHNYVTRKTQQVEALQSILRSVTYFNHRQEALLIHALDNPGTIYTIEGHKNSHNIAYDTARNDLKGLVKKGLLFLKKRGKAFVFSAAPNLSELLKKL